MQAIDYFTRHNETLKAALNACSQRHYWSPFQESPASRHHPTGAKSKGRDRFESLLHTQFLLHHPETTSWVGQEVSPYTGQRLGISYAQGSAESHFKAAQAALPKWAALGVEERIGICIEMLMRCEQQGFENLFATMHTAGMPFTMAYAGAGANALDRGLEALCYAYKAMRDVPTEGTFNRHFGSQNSAYLKKKYRLIPRGPAVVICCGTFPTWNAYPAIMANLATGNPVIVKPHPNGILPMAFVVKACQDLLVELKLDPHLITLAPDDPHQPITLELIKNPRCAIVDFTGSPKFGTWIETHIRHAQIYTETAGCNAIVLESTDDFSGMVKAIGQSLCLFSSQMCTSPQNIYFPQNGIDTNEGHISLTRFTEALSHQIDQFVFNSKTAAALCGAVMSPRTISDIQRLSEQCGDKIIRHSSTYSHPDFPNARTATPLLAFTKENIHHEEHFGPMAFVIPSDNALDGLEQAAQLAQYHGSIAAYAYSANEDFIEQIENRYAQAGASIGINLCAQLPINFTAAYSDYHVTGLNPAGNACLTDLAFVTNRFRIVQSKREFRTP